MKTFIRTDGVELLCERIVTYGEAAVSDVELLTVMLGDASLALDRSGGSRPWLACARRRGWSSRDRDCAGPRTSRG